jgi:hypothetical protein
MATQRHLRPPAHLALAAKYPGIGLADPKGFSSAMQRARINLDILKASRTATLDQTRKELSPLVGALEKLKTALEKRTTAQRRALSFVETAAWKRDFVETDAGKRGLRDGLAEFLDFVPKAEQIFRDALKADAGELKFDITHGKSREPLAALVARLVKIHGQHVGPQISESKFVLWALNEQLNIRNDKGDAFSKEGVRQLRLRGRKSKNPA